MKPKPRGFGERLEMHRSTCGRKGSQLSRVSGLFDCGCWWRVVGALEWLVNACSEKCDSGRVMATGESREEEEQRMPSRCIPFS